jgi:hypothetical protein
VQQAREFQAPGVHVGVNDGHADVTEPAVVGPFLPRPADHRKPRQSIARQLPSGGHHPGILAFHQHGVAL